MEKREIPCPYQESNAGNNDVDRGNAFEGTGPQNKWREGLMAKNVMMAVLCNVSACVVGYFTMLSVSRLYSVG
jgi:hypothetical protein